MQGCWNGPKRMHWTKCPYKFNLTPMSVRQKYKKFKESSLLCLAWSMESTPSSNLGPINMKLAMPIPCLKYLRIILPVWKSIANRSLKTISRKNKKLGSRWSGILIWSNRWAGARVKAHLDQTCRWVWQKKLSLLLLQMQKIPTIGMQTQNWLETREFHLMEKWEISLPWFKKIEESTISKHNLAAWEQPRSQKKMGNLMLQMFWNILWEKRDREK